MTAIIELAQLFAQYKDEILVVSLTLNFVLILLLLWLTADQRVSQTDPVKRAMYNPKPFRKDAK